MGLDCNSMGLNGIFDGIGLSFNGIEWDIQWD